MNPFVLCRMMLVPIKIPLVLFFKGCYCPWGGGGTPRNDCSEGRTASRHVVSPCHPVVPGYHKEAERVRLMIGDPNLHSLAVLPLMRCVLACICRANPVQLLVILQNWGGGGGQQVYTAWLLEGVMAVDVDRGAWECSSHSSPTLC